MRQNAYLTWCIAGTYANDHVGEARIEDAGSGLVLHLGPAGRRYPLRHFNRDVFVYAALAESGNAVTLRIPLTWDA